MFQDFPNLHPLVVHFPIVLILLSAGLQAILVIRNWSQLRWAALFIMGGGFAGALAASTVFHAMPEGLSAKATMVFNEHEEYASYALWLSGITFLLRGIGEYFKVFRRPYEVLVLAFAVLTAVCVSIAGHRGAQLVYVEGVGPKGNLLMKGGHSHGSHSHGIQVPTRNEPPEHSDHKAADVEDVPSPSNQTMHSEEEHNAGSTTGHSASEMAKANKKNGTEQTHQSSGHNMPGEKGASTHKAAGGVHPNPSEKTVKNSQHSGHTEMPGTQKQHGQEVKSSKSRTPEVNVNKQPASSANHDMEGNQEMNHGNMGSGSSNAKTDMFGRPLLVPDVPYDNNPAVEQNQIKKQK